MTGVSVGGRARPETPVMNTHRPHAALVAASAILAVAAPLAGATAPGTGGPAAAPAPTAAAPARPRGPATSVRPLNEADVNAFMETMAAAARARDVAKLASLLAEDADIALTSRVQGPERTTRFTKAQYVEMLDRGYLSMKDLEAYEYEIVEMHVQVAPDGRSATVDSQVVETITLGGRRHATRSHETTRVERREGRPVAVRVTATTTEN